MTPRDFDLWVEDDRIRVRFVSARALGTLSSGHPTPGDYDDAGGVRRIRVFRGETRRALRGVLLHELSHYLCARQETRRRLNEEEACDLASWLPVILHDPRNGALLRFLGLGRR